MKLRYNLIYFLTALISTCLHTHIPLKGNFQQGIQIGLEIYSPKAPSLTCIYEVIPAKHDLIMTGAALNVRSSPDHFHIQRRNTFLEKCNPLSGLTFCCRLSQRKKPNCANLIRATCNYVH